MINSGGTKLSQHVEGIQEARKGEERGEGIDPFGGSRSGILRTVEIGWPRIGYAEFVTS